MGYYSQMKMVCKAEDFEDFKTRYLEASEGDACRLLYDVSIIKGCAVLSAELKWYEGSKEVDAFYEAFEEAFAMTGKPAQFVRIGSDWDDVEVLVENNVVDLAVHISPETTIDVY